MPSSRERSTSATANVPVMPGNTAALVHRLRRRAADLAQQQLGESEACLREAIRLRPDEVDAMNDLGAVVWRQGRLDEAADCYRAAVRIEPRSFHAQLYLGLLVSNRGDFEEAMEPLLAALALHPDSVEVIHYLGTNLMRLGRWAEAITHYERAVLRWPDDPELHRSLGFALLATGDFRRGWPEHEWRLGCKRHLGCRVNRPWWDGGDFRGRTILLHFEQGFGDTMQFIRYSPLVKARGGRVAVLCREPLVGLLSRCEGVDLAFDGATGFEPECHIHAPLMSLPAIFGTTIDTIPGRVPYLSADPDLVTRWRTLLDQIRGPERPFLVGIAWQGEPQHRSDHWRSFPLERFAPLAALPGVRLVSLQVGAGREQVVGLGGRFPVVELPGRAGRDFDETAAIAAQLDLVIAPDTAMAHLAGGLGVPVWVPLSAASDWRWLAGREDSPWYPTLRLFRQTRLEDWEGVFRRIADELRTVLAHRGERAGDGAA